MHVTRINKFQAKAELADDLHDFLLGILPIIRQAVGCASCQLLRSKDDPSEFVIIELWASVAAHKASVNAIAPEQFDLVLPMLARPPMGSYYTVMSA